MGNGKLNCFFEIKRILNFRGRGQRFTAFSKKACKLIFTG
jgi:hypothetical protein